MKLLIGDFNSKIGKDYVIKPNIGEQGLHEITSENGEFLTNFAVTNELLISGTFFQHENIHKATWRSPDGKTCNLIDYILIDLRHRSNLLDARSYRGANIDSDHFQFLSKIRCRLKKSFYQKKEKQLKKLAINELQNPDILSLFKSKLREKLLPDPTNQDNKIDWEMLKQIISDTANETLPEKENKKRRDWFDLDCSLATTKKNKAYKLMIRRHYTRNS